MAVLRCDKGHFYDAEKYQACPHCKNPLPVQRRLGESLTEYRPQAPRASGSVKVRLDPVRAGEEKTVGLYRAALGRDPVVGWLVCTNGKEAGRDYRLHAGRNFVGRSLSMDIALVDDERVSRQEHCAIVFEPKQAVFLLVQGNGEVMADGKPLRGSYPLQGDEDLEIGASTFVFIPFCRKGRLW